MKFCYQCGKPVSDNAKFCPACGTSLVIEEPPKPRTCSKCGEPIGDGDAFCMACGSKYTVSTQTKKIQPSATNHRSVRPVTRENTQYIFEYLSKATMLEKSLYTQNRTIDQIEEKIDSLGQPIHYNKPSSPWEEELDGRDFVDAISAGGTTLIIGGIVGIFTGSIIGGAVVGAMIGFFGSLIIKSMSNASGNNKRNDRYQEDLREYNYAVNEDEKRVQAEKEEAKKLSGILCQMQNVRRETESALQRFYDVDVIFPKYRNLVAVCSFYEYFASGRCDGLIGHEGAYNIYESEARLERICTKLDEVIENLEQIKSNQYFLYDAIQEGNQMSRQILQESVKQSRLAEQTAKSTALAAHYSEIAAKNAEACAWIGVANYVSIEDGKRRLLD